MIIYGSRYGSARIYAEKLGEMTGLPVFPFESIHGIESGIAVYIGALYAGGVIGLKRTLLHVDKANTHLIIVTVGISDPCIEENRRRIRCAVEKELSGFASFDIFHLRGVLDYGRLSLKHRAMMALLHKACSRNPGKVSAEDREFLDTYGKHVDYMDFSELGMISERIMEFI